MASLKSDQRQIALARPMRRRFPGKGRRIRFSATRRSSARTKRRGGNAGGLTSFAGPPLLQRSLCRPPDHSLNQADSNHNASPRSVFWVPSASIASRCARPRSPVLNACRAAWRNCQALTVRHISGSRSAPHREQRREPRKRAWQTGHRLSMPALAPKPEEIAVRGASRAFAETASGGRRTSCDKNAEVARASPYATRTGSVNSAPRRRTTTP